MGGGEGSIMRSGSYLHMLIEAPDMSLGCLGQGQVRLPPPGSPVLRAPRCTPTAARGAQQQACFVLRVSARVRKRCTGGHVRWALFPPRTGS